MPQVKYNPQKGLHQLSGTGLQGFQLQNISAGDTSIVHYSQASTGGYGFHRVMCIVPVAAHAVASNDVAARVPWYVPSNTGTTIKFAAIWAETLHTSDNSLYALEYHTADIAVDSPSAGTELIGAAPNTSKPDADLDMASGDGTLGQMITSGTAGSKASGGATYFHICAKEGITATGTAKIGVIVEYYGPAPVAL